MRPITFRLHHYQNKLLLTAKIFGQEYSYSIFKVQESPTNTENYWLGVLNIEEDIDWSVVHDNNFTCSIETQLTESILLQNFS